MLCITEYRFAVRGLLSGSLIKMFFSNFIATLAAVPLIAVGTPGTEVAQSADLYADWLYLYEDTFEDNSGAEITQNWWLNPDTNRRNNILEFTLLARRSPVSANGTAAAVFGYLADCSNKNYTLERAEFLDSNNATLDVQTYQRVMEPADPDTSFANVLDDLCSGEL